MLTSYNRAMQQVTHEEMVPLYYNNSENPLPSIVLPYYMIRQVKVIFSGGFLRFKFLFYCPCLTQEV